MRKMVRFVARSRVLEIIILVVLAAILMAIFNVLLYSNIEILPTEEALPSPYGESGSGGGLPKGTASVQRRGDSVQRQGGHVQRGGESVQRVESVQRGSVHRIEGRIIESAVIQRRRKHLIAVNEIQLQIQTVEKLGKRNPEKNDPRDTYNAIKDEHSRFIDDGNEFRNTPEYASHHKAESENSSFVANITIPKHYKMEHILSEGNSQDIRELNSKSNSRIHVSNNSKTDPSRVINNTPQTNPGVIKTVSKSDPSHGGPIKNASISKSNSVQSNHASLIANKLVPSSTKDDRHKNTNITTYNSRNMHPTVSHTDDVYNNGENDQNNKNQNDLGLRQKQQALHTKDMKSDDETLKSSRFDEFETNDHETFKSSTVNELQAKDRSAAVQDTIVSDNMLSSAERQNVLSPTHQLSLNQSDLSSAIMNGDHVVSETTNEHVVDESSNRNNNYLSHNSDDESSKGGQDINYLAEKGPVDLKSEHVHIEGEDVNNDMTNKESSPNASNQNQDNDNQNKQESLEPEPSFERVENNDFQNSASKPVKPHWDRILHMPSTGYHSFNISMSDNIGNSRAYPEMRTKACFDLDFKVDIEFNVSIIVVFHNEARSALLRTIHSILDRTPVEILSELILIDDASTYPWLLEPLQDYISVVSDKIILIRMQRREGLIRARLIGAEKSRGDILVFLDAHVEVGDNWLPPMLTEIRNFPQTITVPSMDIIHWETFEFFRAKDNYQGSFLWDLVFRYKLLSKDMLPTRSNLAEPYPSPVMVGCAHALRRDYFFSMGSYDDGMDIWGGENLEHSFRTWMCGGRVMITPCSRVAHIFKPKLPYSFRNSAVETIQRNLVRVAEVWMDHYAKYFYALQENLPPIELHTLEPRKKLRKDLNCKSFQWYMDNVAPDIPVPPVSATYFGQLKSVKFPSKCIEFDSAEEILELRNCEQQDLLEQHFYLDRAGRFRYKHYCVTVHTGMLAFSELCVPPSNDQSSDFDDRVTEEFHWSFANNQIMHVATQRCLTLTQWDSIVTSQCVDEKSHFIDRSQQMWEFAYKFDFSNKTAWNLSTILIESIRKPSNAVHFGALMNVGNTESGSAINCLRIFDGAIYEILPCDKQPVYDQVLYIDTQNNLRYKSLQLAHNPVTSSLFIFPQQQSASIHLNNDLAIETQWRYDVDLQGLMIESHDELCLTLVGDNRGSLDVAFETCRQNSDWRQKWVFQAPTIKGS